MEKISISGMVSPSCARVISHIISTFTGVESASVDYSTGEACVSYDYSVFTQELSDSIAMSIERAGYEVTLNRGVTIEYISIKQVVRNDYDAIKVTNLFQSYQWVQRIYVDVDTNVAAVFVKAHTSCDVIDSALEKLRGQYQRTRPLRDVHIDIETCPMNDNSGSDWGDYLSGCRSSAHYLYNSLKQYSSRVTKEEVTVSSVYVNVSLKPPQARVKGNITIAEISSYLSTIGYAARACSESRHPLMPSVVKEQGVLSASSLCADPVASVHNHIHGGFMLVPDGDTDQKVEFLNDVNSSQASSTDSRYSSSTLSLTPPRDLGATPRTWKSNSNKLEQSPQPQMTPSPQANSSSKPKTRRSRRSSHRSKKLRPGVIQIGHTANMVATFSLGGTEDLTAEKVNQIEEEIRRQCFLTLGSPVSNEKEGKAARNLLRSISGSYASPVRCVESFAAAVYDVRVHLFFEKVEILYDSSLLLWSDFVESISRAGFHAVLLDLRTLNNDRDLRTRRFLMSSNTSHEDIEHDLFTGVSALKSSGGVMNVCWIDDTDEVRTDIRTLLQSTEAKTIFDSGTFSVLEVTYDSLVLPLFELYDVILMSSSNRLYVCMFPSELFIHRRSIEHVSYPLCLNSADDSDSHDWSHGLDMDHDLINGLSDHAVSDTKEFDLDTSAASRTRLAVIKTQCGIACVLSFVLVLLAYFNPLLESSNDGGEDFFEHKRKALLKIGFYEIASFLLTSAIVFFSGMPVNKDTCYSLMSWRGLRENPYLLIGLGTWSAYALGVMTLFTIICRLHLIEHDAIPSDVNQNVLFSMGLSKIHPAEYFMLAAIFTSFYLIILLFHARHHFKWPIIGWGNNPLSIENGVVETVDRLAQSFLMLRPQFCVLLIVAYPNESVDDSESKRNSVDAGPSPLVGDLQYNVLRDKIISSEVVKRGDLICVKRGEVIPIDGELVRGRAKVEEGLLTGSLTLIDKEPGDYLLGGSTLLECEPGGIHILVHCEVEQSILEQLLRLTLQNALRRNYTPERSHMEYSDDLTLDNKSAIKSSGFIPTYTLFPLESPSQIRIVALFNRFILLFAVIMWILWNMLGLLNLSPILQMPHFDLMVFGIQFVMSLNLAFLLLLLTAPIMIGLLLANVLVLFLSSQIATAWYGIGVQPVSTLLLKMSKLSSMVWSKQSLSNPQLQVTSLYLLSRYGSDRVLVGGSKQEGLDAIDKLCIEGFQPLSASQSTCIDKPYFQAKISGDESVISGSPRDNNENEYPSEDLVVYLAGVSQLSLQHERPISHAITSYAKSKLFCELVTPTSYKLSPCGGVKCTIALPSPLASSMGHVQRPVEVVVGSLEYLRDERMRLSANSLLGNMAHLAEDTHGAHVVFIAIDGEVSGMFQIQRRVLRDAEITVRSFGARRVQSWMATGDSLRTNVPVAQIVGIPSLNILSEAYPHLIVKHIDRLQSEDNELVGYAMPSMDEMEVRECVHSIDPTVKSSSRRNMFFLGKLLHSMPAMFRADVGISRRPPQLPLVSQFRGSEGKEVNMARNLLDSAAEIVVLGTTPRPVAPANDSTVSNQDTDEDADENSFCNLFSLVVIADLSDKIEFLLKGISWIIAIAGLLFLLCLLLYLYCDSTAVLHSAVKSTLLFNLRVSSLFDVLLVTWLPLYAPGTVSATLLTGYLLSLVGCIVVTIVVYLTMFYVPPRRRDYRGLMKGVLETSSDNSFFSNGEFHSSLITRQDSDSASDIVASPRFSALETMLSFTAPGSDSPVKKQVKKKLFSTSIYDGLQSDVSNGENTPLLQSKAAKSKPDTLQPSSGKRRSSFDAPLSYGSLEMEMSVDEYDV